MTILIVIVCIAILIILISWAKWNTFLSFLVVSLMAGWLLKMPPDKIVYSVKTGIGNVMGDLVVIICLGAMLGKIVAESGAAKKIADVSISVFGKKHFSWAMMLTGFIVGIPLFYNVGFVLLVPLVFSITYKTGLPAVYTALPMLAALSVTHGFLPPHPSPSAIAIQLHADPGKVLLYGILIAIPAMIVAGPVFAKTVKNINPQTPTLFQPIQQLHNNQPGAANSFLSSLLPALLLVIVTIILPIAKTDYPSSVSLLTFFGDPIIILLLSVLMASWSLGTCQGMSIKTVMNLYGESVKDVSMILLIVAGSGALKQILVDSGVSSYLGEALKTLSLNPLLLGWLAAAVIRVCVGSATVAGLTAAGVIAPLIATTGTNVNLMVLSIGAGSLMFSHVNDSGFWMFKEYFNLTLKDTLRSWSVMETIVSVMGLIGVLLLEVFLK